MSVLWFEIILLFLFREWGLVDFWFLRWRLDNFLSHWLLPFPFIPFGFRIIFWLIVRWQNALGWSICFWFFFLSEKTYNWFDRGFWFSILGRHLHVYILIKGLIVIIVNQISCSLILVFYCSTISINHSGCSILNL
jgi:hypothetical protein